MCVRVQYVSSCTFPPYDAARNVIQVPDHLDGPYALLAVRKVLSLLVAEQPPTGAVCWCGEPVRLLASVTRQRENGDQVVIHHGT